MKTIKNLGYVEYVVNKYLILCSWQREAMLPMLIISKSLIL